MQSRRRVDLKTKGVVDPKGIRAYQRKEPKEYLHVTGREAR